MSVRIYKDNLRQSVFRTLIFTDIVVFVLTGVLLAGLTFLVFNTFFRPINWMYYLFVLGMIEPTFVIIATLKIDNQAIYKILSRAIFYSLNPKEYRGKQLGGYYNDFTIQDDVIIRKRSICKVFRINPYDISALNGSDRESFFASVKQTLHMLPAKLQIIVRKEVATAADFTDHLLYVYSTLPKKNKIKEAMVNNYQNEYLAFVEQEKLLTVKQYGVFALPVDTSNHDLKVKTIGKLEDMYKRIASSLESCHVTTKRLTNEELAQYMKGVLR